MADDAPRFDEQGRLIAPRYRDVYFSAEDGLAETRHVFLEGNRLAERFAAMRPGECFTIGETGFGTGLNFLAAWELFDRHAPEAARLAFLSIEDAPLQASIIERALAPWPELDRCREALLAQWGPIWPGPHRFRFAQGRARLTLLVGEAEQGLGSIDGSVDAWFLDGFAPSRNKSMWSEAVFHQVARLSATHATLATYTAAGHVRRGLEAVGFDIRKRPGFGRKRDMTVGHLSLVRQHEARPDHAVVIGGSLAGAFAARSLAERGMAVTVIERQRTLQGELPSLVPRVAVLQPKISDIEDPVGHGLREGYGMAERLLRSDPTIAATAGWHACGTFQAAYDERSEKRLKRFVDQFAPTSLCRWIGPDDTEREVGVQMPVGGVLIERAGVLRPAGLCAALLDDPRITFRAGVEAKSLERRSGGWSIATNRGGHKKSGCVVVANARDAARFRQTAGLPLKPVRGQVTRIRPGEVADFSRLKRALFYGGYATPALHGAHSLGASFVPGDEDTAWRDSEHLGCCEKLSRILPDAADASRSIQDPSGWVGVRTTSPSHRSYAGQVQPGLFVSLGHGSHGISSAARAGEHLACLITKSIHDRSG